MSFYREVYEKLSKIELPTEQERGITYVPWAKAWDELMKVYPDSAFEYGPVTRYEDGTAMVEVSVTIKGKTRESATRSEMLPVMRKLKKGDSMDDIAVKNPNAFQINTAYKRCLAKCLGLFGLGLYIYEREDLPDYSEDEASELIAELLEHKSGETKAKFYKALGTEDISKADPNKLKPALKWLKEAA